MSKEQTKTSTATTTQPAWLTGASQDLASRAEQLSTRPVTPYTGEMAAPLSSDQSTAFQSIRDIIAQMSPQITGAAGTATTGAQEYAAAPAQTVSYSDPGQINADTAKLINPYVDASLAPTLRQIQEQSDAQKKQIEAQGTEAGAFGDARQGVEEAMLGRDTSMAMGEATGTAYKSAEDAAQAAAENIAQGRLTAGTTTANLAEQALQRLLTGTQAPLSVAGTEAGQLYTGTGQQQQAGAVEQQTQQAIDTANLSEFLRQQGWDYNTIQTLASALGAMPSFATTQTTSTQPDNWLESILGAAAGKAASAGAASI